MPTPVAAKGPARPYMSPPHLKVTPPDGGGYPPDEEEDKLITKIKTKEDKTMLDDTLKRLEEKEAEPIGTETKEVPKCPEGMHW